MTHHRIEIEGLRIISEANIREHWAKRHKRHKQIEFLITHHLQMHVKAPLSLPVRITLTRVAPRSFDYDNLLASLKKPVDVICDFLRPGLAPGQADNTDQIEIVYKQASYKTPKYYALLIELEEIATQSPSFSYGEVQGR